MKTKRLPTLFLVLLLISSLSFANTNSVAAPSPLSIHFIDVGQADSILIQTPSGQNMLVDAGNRPDADTILSYLHSQKVKKIDILVGTHPHEDHIGAMDKVIDKFPIPHIYLCCPNQPVILTKLLFACILWTIIPSNLRQIYREVKG